MKTIQEINEKIKKGKAVVFTAEEIIDFVKDKGAKRAAEEVDVVTTGTFGVLQPRLGNANYCSAGQLSPLLCDPLYRTIGVGTRIFLGGGTGYVVWQVTQHNPCVPRTELGVPKVPAGTLAVIGDLKQMKAQWLLGTSFRGYEVTLTVGIGVPIPVLDEDRLIRAAVRDEK